MKVQVDRNSGAFAHFDIEIESPIQKVFEKIIRVEEWPTWNEAVKKMKLNGPLQEWSTFDWTAAGMKINSRFHTINPYTEIGWTGRTLWIDAVHNWQLLDLCGRTKLIVEEHFKGIGTFFLKNMLNKDVKKSAEGLKVKPCFKN